MPEEISTGQETEKEKEEKEKEKDPRVTRVEKRLIKKRNPWYSILDDLCIKTKTLYNYAHYLQKMKFGEEGTTYKEFDLSKICSTTEEYRDLPAQTAQQVIKMLCKNWKSYAMAVSQFKKHPEKFKKKPCVPKFLNKETGRYVAVFTNQQAKLLADGTIKFPSRFTDQTIPTTIKDGLQQVRIIPGNRQYTIEIVYKIMPQPAKEDNGRYMGIDLGVNTLAAIVSNTGMKPYLIRGYRLKSLNKHYSENKAYFQEKAQEMNNTLDTNRLASLNRNRYNRLMTFFHKTSREIINIALKENINTIIIGDGKQVGKFEDKMVIDIPVGILLHMITYKAEEVGINVKVTEETFTSHTSFMDDEEPTEFYYDENRRVKENFYYGPGNKQIINSDVNAAFQIIKKEIPTIKFSSRDKQLALDPIIIEDILVDMPKVGDKYARW